MEEYNRRRQEFIESFNYKFEDTFIDPYDFDYDEEWAISAEDLKVMRLFEKINLYECRSIDEIEEILSGKRSCVLQVYPEFFKDVPPEFMKGFGYDMCSVAIRRMPHFINDIPDEVLLDWSRESYFELCRSAVEADPSILYDESNINRKFRYLSDSQIEELKVLINSSMEKVD